MSEKKKSESLKIGPVGTFNKRKGGRSKMGGPYSEGAHVNCICSTCGYKMAYIASEPCAHKLCPKCKNNMTKNR